MKAWDAVEAALPASFFEGAPYHRVSLMIRVDSADESGIAYKKLRKDGELEVSVQVAVSRLVDKDADSLKTEFLHIILQGLQWINEAYNRDAAGISS